MKFRFYEGGDKLKLLNRYLITLVTMVLSVMQAHKKIYFLIRLISPQTIPIKSHGIHKYKSLTIIQTQR